MKLMKKIKNVIKIIYSESENDLEEISLDDYKKAFIENRLPEEIKETYNKAWESKNFEISNYWKRANYFWAFQVASFAGYFAVLNSNSYPDNPEVLYCVICIGFITSIAWILTNKGSKIWQRNWESHVNLLEDYITGPLYKVVHNEKTYSVSKLNEIVSFFFMIIWILLALKFFIDNITFNYFENVGLSYLVLLSTLLVILFTLIMIFGYGRGKYEKRKRSIYIRKLEPRKE
jgi:hypothetical protein